MRKLIVFSVLLVMVAPLFGAAGRVVAQDTEEDITFDFTFYEGNPVLLRGQEGEWDAASVQIGCIIHDDNTFYMLYGGSSENVAGSAIGHSAIGLATSEDGFTWTKYEANPVLEWDTVGGVWPGPCVLENGLWILYLTPRDTIKDLPGQTVLRATALDPSGPWTVGEEVIPEAPQRWDFGIVASSLALTDDGYVLYYFGFDGRSHASFGIGRATSPDGVTFTKYDDPATTSSLNTDTDPVFVNGTGWDAEVMMVSVRPVGSGWEMFYTALEDGWRGSPGYIGYATSEDGITWTRRCDAPMLTLGEADVGIWWPFAIVVNDTYYLYFNILPVYHTYQEVGVAIGTITRGEVGE